jgi:hypothetical protein
MENIMRNINLLRLTGATAVVVLGLAACGDSPNDVPAATDPAAVATTVAQPEQYPNDCGVRLPRIDTPVRC